MYWFHPVLLHILIIQLCQINKNIILSKLCYLFPRRNTVPPSTSHSLTLPKMHTAVSYYLSHSPSLMISPLSSLPSIQSLLSFPLSSSSHFLTCPHSPTLHWSLQPSINDFLLPAWIIKIPIKFKRQCFHSIL